MLDLGSRRECISCSGDVFIVVGIRFQLGAVIIII